MSPAGHPDNCWLLSPTSPVGRGKPRQHFTLGLCPQILPPGSARVQAGGAVSPGKVQAGYGAGPAVTNA